MCNNIYIISLNVIYHIFVVAYIQTQFSKQFKAFPIKEPFWVFSLDYVFIEKNE